jgi:dinuclear metal center YbgI/SA1388 family protein
MKLNELEQYLAQVLQPEKFNDYCPNGLQVEGKNEIKKIVTGVTASMALLEAAAAADADAILVHHGYFWRGESPVVTGLRRNRIRFLLANEMSLFAYHLPLDAHPLWGNNVMLAKALGWDILGYLDEKHMLPWAEAKQSLGDLAQHLESTLGRKPMLIGDVRHEIKKIAWCTGAAQSYIEQAINARVDVFVSGEISEQTVHLARESGVAYIAAGHHATERYGVSALGEHLSQKFDIDQEFIDLDNPV